MAVQLVNMNLYLSGGAANTDPNDSLGDEISSTRVTSQTFGTANPIAGITLLDAVGNAVGNGALVYTVVGQTLMWTPPGGAQGTAVALTGNGEYIVRGAGANAGYLRISVVFASLPVSNNSVVVPIAYEQENLFDDVTKAEALAGDVGYRCYYLFNDHATDTAIGVVVWIYADSLGADTISIGADPAGVGDGAATGVAATIANEHAAPAGVSFSQPTTEGAAIALGDFPAGEGAAVWIKRDVPVSTLVPYTDDVSLLRWRFLT